VQPAHFDAKMSARATPGYAAARKLRRAFLRGVWRDDMGALLWDVITDLDGLVAGVLERASSTVCLSTQAEHPGASETSGSLASSSGG